MNNKDKFCLICNVNIANAISVNIIHPIEKSMPVITLYQFLQSITNFKNLDIRKVSNNVCQKCCVQTLTLYEFQSQCNNAAAAIFQKAKTQKKLSLGKTVTTTYIPKPGKAKIVNQVQVVNQENIKTEVVFAESFPEIAPEDENSDSNDDWFIPKQQDEEMPDEQEMTNESVGSQADDNTNTCEICSKSFRTKVILRNHMKRRHEKKCAVCTVCGTVETPKTYPCEKCQKVYTNSTSLIYHMHSHGIGVPYECTDCGKKFKRGDRLRAHQSKGCPGKQTVDADMDNTSNEGALGALGEGSSS